jgi:hypothetical protein
MFTNNNVLQTKWRHAYLSSLINMGPLQKVMRGAAEPALSVHLPSRSGRLSSEGWLRPVVLVLELIA